MDGLYQFAYETLPEPKTMGNFLLTVSATIAGGFLLIVFRPILIAWARSVKRLYDRARDQETKSWSYCGALLRGSLTEEHKRSRSTALRYFRNMLILLLILAISLGLLLGVAQPIIQEDIEQSHGEILHLIKRQLNQYDQMESQLHQQTSDGRIPESICEESVLDLDRARAEILCKEEVESEGALLCRKNGTRRQAKPQTYFGCMLDRGWMVSRCTKVEERCSEVKYEGHNCDSGYWRTESKYIGKECLSHVPDSIMVTFEEIECRETATQFAFDSMYKGYKEMDRLWGTTRAYRLCMQKKGWHTSECSRANDVKGNCKSILYPEGSCLTQLRRWVATDDRDFRNIPCKGEF